MSEVIGYIDGLLKYLEVRQEFTAEERLLALILKLKKDRDRFEALLKE